MGLHTAVYKYFYLKWSSDCPHLFGLSEAELVKELDWWAGRLSDALGGGGFANMKELRNLHTASRG